MREVPEEEELPLEYVDMRTVGDESVTAVMSALQFQHKLFLREMDGALLPEEIPLDSLSSIMDFICGPGSWSLDLSKKYPDKQIVGVDINTQIIHLAQENVVQSRTSNLTFAVVDRTRPLPFPDESFDLIHLQNGTSLFTLRQWPEILKQMFRLLKPGGWLNLVDFEMGPTSHAALDHVLGILGQILVKLDRSVAPGGVLPLNGCTLGPQRLSQFAFTDIKYHLYPVNLGGWNNPIGRAFLRWNIVRPEMILHLATRTGVKAEEDLQPLLREMQRELLQIGFCGVGMLISVFGRKPVTAKNDL